MVSAKLDEHRSVLREQQIDALEAAVTATLRELGVDASSARVRKTLARQFEAALHPDREHRTDDLVNAKVVFDYAAPSPSRSRWLDLSLRGNVGADGVNVLEPGNAEAQSYQCNDPHTTHQPAHTLHMVGSDV